MEEGKGEVCCRKGKQFLFVRNVAMNLQDGWESVRDVMNGTLSLNS